MVLFMIYNLVLFITGLFFVYGHRVYLLWAYFLFTAIGKKRGKKRRKKRKKEEKEKEKNIYKK